MSHSVSYVLYIWLDAQRVSSASLRHGGGFYTIVGVWGDGFKKGVAKTGDLTPPSLDVDRYIVLLPGPGGASALYDIFLEQSH